MPRLQKGHWYILCVIDKMTNYLITAPLYQARSEEVGEALIENVISKFGTPDSMMMDEDSAFLSSLMMLLVQEPGYQYQNSRPLQSQVITSRTWHKVLVVYAIQIFDRPGADVAQISVVSHICLQYISYAQSRKLFPI